MPQNYPKSISREPLVVESWLTTQNDHKAYFIIGFLRYVYPSDKFPENTFFFGGPYNDKIA